jgi:hypothetical protein
MHPLSTEAIESPKLKITIMLCFLEISGIVIHEQYSAMIGKYAM